MGPFQIAAQDPEPGHAPGKIPGQFGCRRLDLAAAKRCDHAVEMSLRTAEGMDLCEYRALAGSDFPGKQRHIDRLVLESLAFIRGDRLILTERGMDVLNAVIELLA